MSVSSTAFDVFDPGFNQRLVFEPYTDPHTLLRRVAPHFTLSGAVLHLQPIVRILDVNATLVEDLEQTASVQISVDVPEGADGSASLYGGTLVDSDLGVATFIDVAISG